MKRRQYFWVFKTRFGLNLNLYIPETNSMFGCKLRCIEAEFELEPYEIGQILGGN